MGVVALRAGAATDVGLVRTNNQDSHLTADPLYAVADGMGGAAAGEVASALAVEALSNGFHRGGTTDADLLIQAAQAANRAVWDEAEANPEMRGMGTTLVAIALVEGPELAIVNIGDSRLYVLHDQALRQITFDHNLVAEMVAQGRITPAEAEVHPRRNIMTRALGVEPEVPIDLFVEEPVLGDRYLLCSDGLPREVSDDLIASLLTRFADAQEAADELVDEAKRRGGNDNITVVVVDVVDDDASADDQGQDPTAALPTADPGADPTADPTADPDAGARVLEAVPPATSETETATATKTKPARPTRSFLNFRVAGFVLLLLMIVIGAAAAIVWYARSSYYVGLEGSQIVIYQGRPGGVLGMDPTLKQVTPYTTEDVLSSAIAELQAGHEEPSLAAANEYVRSLVDAKASAENSAAPPTTTPSPTTSPSGGTATTRPPPPATTVKTS